MTPGYFVTSKINRQQQLEEALSGQRWDDFISKNNNYNKLKRIIFGHMGTLCNTICSMPDPTDWQFRKKFKRCFNPQVHNKFYKDKKNKNH